MVLEVERESTRLSHSVRRAVAAPSGSPRLVVGVIAVLTLATTIAGIRFGGYISHSVFIPLIVLAGFLLSGRHLARGTAIVLAGFTLTAVPTWSLRAAHWSTLGVLVAVVGLVFRVTRRRQTMGVPLSVASGMLKDLRSRLDRQALTPDLPEDMHLEHCVLAARGDAFSGDFVVSSLRGRQLDVALTDVSGSGPSAGMRALLLSGALSGLLGETAPEDFLPAANRYLIRQGWRDGFASAVHVSLDVDSGDFCLGTAGHPAAAHYRAAAGRWEMVTGAAGLLLGVFEQGTGDYVRAPGRLEPGDVLLLYTDGVVEGPHGDVAAGTRRLLRLADDVVGEGLDGAARRLCAASLRAGGDDDRSVVAIWRALPPSGE